MAKAVSDLLALALVRPGGWIIPRGWMRATSALASALLIVNGARSTSLWVPRISSTSCDQAIFVDHATDSRAPSDTVLLKVDGFG